MSILNNSLLLGADAGAAGYQVSRSIRLNASDSAFLSRTPASAGNRKTWTWSGWVKRSGLGDKVFFSAYTGSGSTDNSYFAIRFISSDQLHVGGYSTVYRVSTAVFRDASAWYHIVCAVDTTQATATDRIKLWANGSQITTFSTENNPTQNADLGINQAAGHTIGREAGFASYYDGYLADIHFIDGQALTPSSFAETNATTGQWVPKAYTGSYGTNGFQLKFADNSNNTAATLGKDTSGNGNNWTPNNLSVTAGAGNDSLTDTPTSYGTGNSGGDVRGNYATLNPLPNTSGAAVLTNGNLDYTGTQSVTYALAGSSIAVSSGKWYWEVTIGSTLGPNLGIGVFRTSNPDYSTFTSGTDGGIAFFHGIANTIYYWNGSSQSTSYTLASCTTGDVVSVALDLDNGGIYFAKNGSWGASGNPATQTNPALTGLSGSYAAGISIGASGTSTATFNFGQRPFAYTAPSGFKALCDTNLPAPVVAKPNTVMDVVTYTGTGASRSITGLSFSPDWVWIKSRSNGAYHHRLVDTVRGATKEIYSNLTNAEGTDPVGLTAFNSDGFTLGSSNEYNASGQTFVGWTWDAGSSTVTNTQGSITSQVRANASAGFSVVVYTGAGGTQTVGHGLGVKPSLIIIKRRDVTSNWLVYHASVGATKYLYLNATDASASWSGFWGNTEPTSSVFTLGGDGAVNNSGSSHVAYCFAPVAGYSAFGSYTGNGSADGPFVFTGFRPRWVMFKSSSSATDWVIEDAARSTYNVIDARLFPNTSDAELSNGNGNIDYCSNGFKLRNSHVAMNSSGATYVWAAFAESPFAYARAR